jgi:hypothetical protein
MNISSCILFNLFGVDSKGLRDEMLQIIPSRKIENKLRCFHKKKKKMNYNLMKDELIFFSKKKNMPVLGV